MNPEPLKDKIYDCQIIDGGCRPESIGFSKDKNGNLLLIKDVASAVLWLKEWELQETKEQCQKCGKKSWVMFAKYKGCLELRCYDCLLDEAFAGVREVQM
jgi:hypothetical protein